MHLRNQHTSQLTRARLAHVRRQDRGANTRHTIAQHPTHGKLGHGRARNLQQHADHAHHDDEAKHGLPAPDLGQRGRDPDAQQLAEEGRGGHDGLGGGGHGPGAVGQLLAELHGEVGHGDEAREEEHVVPEVEHGQGRHDGDVGDGPREEREPLLEGEVLVPVGGDGVVAWLDGHFDLLFFFVFSLVLSVCIFSFLCCWVLSMGDRWFDINTLGK